MSGLTRKPPQGGFHGGHSRAGTALHYRCTPDGLCSAGLSDPWLGGR